jgi:hypothetical protein
LDGASEEGALKKATGGGEDGVLVAELAVREERRMRGQR